MMRHFRLALAALSVLLAAPASAQVQMAALAPDSAKLVEDVAAYATRELRAMPAIRMTGQLAAVCGGGEGHDLMRYCTSENAIFVSARLAQEVPDRAQAGYLLAHMLGHAVQVRHGQADVALAAIRAEPAREAVIRGMVTRQVECLAGVIHAGALGRGQGSPRDWFVAEPFTEAHWGAAPLSAGPRVSIGLEERDAWFRKGRDAGSFEACAVDEFGAERLMRALN